VRIAIVGTGISGLISTHLLHRHHDVTVFEAADHPGGHTRTVSVPVAEGEVAVDTGFIVYNQDTYPGFVRLLDELGVASHPADMSFSVRDDRANLEYRGSSPATVFAQPANALRPAFLRMLADVGRFHRRALELAADDPGPDYTLGDLLAERRWSPGFVDWYLVPLGSSIWSADPASVTAMPAGTLARFFARHGMLSVRGRPPWRTVTGGARRYVDAVLAPVAAAGRLRLGMPVDGISRTPDGVAVRAGGRLTPEYFDHVVLATHSDQALGLLTDPTPDEKEVLGAIAYQPNRAVLHTDDRILPRHHRARAAWNYRRPAPDRHQATLTYDLNRLQSLPTSTPVLVTLNEPEAIDPSRVLATFEDAHPVLDGPAVAAQRRHAEISGVHGVSYCGAYWGYGFHEDGLQSGLAVCRALGVRW
jgi:predicted NAD/FAD-binding protein